MAKEMQKDCEFVGPNQLFQALKNSSAAAIEPIEGSTA
jgi:hypothetical protein